MSELIVKTIYVVPTRSLPSAAISLCINLNKTTIVIKRLQLKIIIENAQMGKTANHAKKRNSQQMSSAETIHVNL